MLAEASTFVSGMSSMGTMSSVPGATSSASGVFHYDQIVDPDGHDEVAVN